MFKLLAAIGLTMTLTPLPPPATLVNQDALKQKMAICRRIDIPNKGYWYFHLNVPSPLGMTE
jgi:hypothetical protein